MKFGYTIKDGRGGLSQSIGHETMEDAIMSACRLSSIDYTPKLWWQFWRTGTSYEKIGIMLFKACKETAQARAEGLYKDP